MKLYYVLLVIQCSAGSNLLRSRPCSTDPTEGLCTSCSTNKCDYKQTNNCYKYPVHSNLHNSMPKH